MHRRFHLLLSLMVLSMPAIGADPVVSARLGSLGFGIEAGIGLTEQFSTRLGLNRYDFDFDQRVGGIEYDLDLELRSIALFADWHPFDSSFRFTAGVLRNNNEISGVTQSSTMTIGDTLYPGVGLEVDVEYRSLAPYLGLGWESGFIKAHGWGFNVDLGIMYQGAGSVSLIPIGLAADMVDPDDVAQEERRFEEDMADYKYYPVFSFGVSYKF
jgi:hypothetical protein